MNATLTPESLFAAAGEDPCAAPEFGLRCQDCGVELVQRNEVRLSRCPACRQQVIDAAEKERMDGYRAKRLLMWADVLKKWDARSFTRHPEFFLTHCLPAYQQRAHNWIDLQLPLDTALRKGAGFIGQPGTGKTVAAGYCLRAAFLAGKTVAITSDHALSRIANTKATGSYEAKDHAEQEYQSLLQARVLLIDDVGQSCTSGLARTLLLALVHERNKAGRTLLWTAQSGVNWIATRLGCVVHEKDGPIDPATGQPAYRMGHAILTEEVAAFLRRIGGQFCLVG